MALYKFTYLLTYLEPTKFRPAADPLPGGAGRPKSNELEMSYLYLQSTNYKPSLVKIDAR